MKATSMAAESSEIKQIQTSAKMRPDQLIEETNQELEDQFVIVGNCQTTSIHGRFK